MAAIKKQVNKRKIPPITIRNAKLIYRNFSGTAKQFNAKGLRNFNVVLDGESAKMLERDGWNIKWDKPQEDGDSPRARLKVAVRFDNYPPRIWLITAGGKTLLDEDTVTVLDDAELETVDLVLTASTGEMDGKPYVKAYLSKMFATLSEDDLEAKYASVGSNRRPAIVEDED